jgi:hypothetical protein
MYTYIYMYIYKTYTYISTYIYIYICISHLESVPRRISLSLTLFNRYSASNILSYLSPFKYGMKDGNCSTFEVIHNCRRFIFSGVNMLRISSSVRRMDRRVESRRESSNALLICTYICTHVSIYTYIDI